MQTVSLFLVAHWEQAWRQRGKSSGMMPVECAGIEARIQGLPRADNKINP